MLYKIDGRSGDVGRILWRMDPSQEKLPLTNRGAALWGNFVITAANYPARVIATDKETGKVVWETNLNDQPDVQLTAAPLAVKDKIIVGAAGGDRGVRDWIAALDAATGKLEWRKYVIPAPGEPGSETWKDKNNAWQIGGGAMWVTGSYDAASNQVIWGTGNPVPMFDPTYRPGDNLYTDSVISWNPDSGKMNWYFQYMPGDMWDYDAAHSHILIDGEINGQPRKLITHSARNGFLYTLERNNGQPILAKPYVETINWTEGIDQKTGKPVDYDPTRDIQVYSGKQNQTLTERTRKLCPSMQGGSNYWPTAYSRKTGLLYIPSISSCNELTLDPSLSTKAGDWKGAKFRDIERNETDLMVADPLTGEMKKRVHVPYPDYSGRARDWRRFDLYWLCRRHAGRLRRHHDGAALEDQRRHRLQRAADDVRRSTVSNMSRFCRDLARFRSANSALRRSSRNNATKPCCSCSAFEAQPTAGE